MWHLCCGLVSLRQPVLDRALFQNSAVPEQWFTVPEQHCSGTVKQLFRNSGSLFQNSTVPEVLDQISH